MADSCPRQHGRQLCGLQRLQAQLREHSQQSVSRPAPQWTSSPLAFGIKQSTGGLVSGRVLIGAAAVQVAV